MAQRRPTRQRWHWTSKARQLVSWKTCAHNICPGLIEDDIRREIKNSLIQFQWQLNSHLPLIQRKLRLMDIMGFSMAHWEGGRGFQMWALVWHSEEWAGKQLATVLGRGRVIIRGLFLLIISRSAECGEKPAACGPERLFSYARPSWYGGRATEPR